MEETSGRVLVSLEVRPHNPLPMEGGRTRSFRTDPPPRPPPTSPSDLLLLETLLATEEERSLQSPWSIQFILLVRLVLGITLDSRTPLYPDA